MVLLQDFIPLIPFAIKRIDIISGGRYEHWDRKEFNQLLTIAKHGNDVCIVKSFRVVSYSALAIEIEEVAKNG